MQGYGLVAGRWWALCTNRLRITGACCNGGMHVSPFQIAGILLPLSQVIPSPDCHEPGKLPRWFSQLNELPSLEAPLHDVPQAFSRGELSCPTPAVRIKWQGISIKAHYLARQVRQLVIIWEVRKCYAKWLDWKSTRVKGRVKELMCYMKGSQGRSHACLAPAMRISWQGIRTQAYSAKPVRQLVEQGCIWQERMF